MCRKSTGVKNEEGKKKGRGGGGQPSHRDREEFLSRMREAASYSNVENLSKEGFSLKKLINENGSGVHILHVRDVLRSNGTMMWSLSAALVLLGLRDGSRVREWP